MSGIELEIVIGNCTFMSLVNRSILSVFSSVYKFVGKHYYERVQVWDTVWAELSAFLGLMPLLSGDWTREWLPQVTAVDASLSGWSLNGWTR